jgi:hypothetical protein
MSLPPKGLGFQVEPPCLAVGGFLNLNTQLFNPTKQCFLKFPIPKLRIILTLNLIPQEKKRKES